MPTLDARVLPLGLAAFVAAPVFAGSASFDGSLDVTRHVYAAELDTTASSFEFDPTASLSLGMFQDAAGADGDAGGADAAGSMPTLDDEMGGDPLVSREVLPRFGERGDTRIRITGGYGVDVKTSRNSVGILGVGFTAFVEEGLAFTVELNGLEFSQEVSNATGVNFNLLIEWHFYMEDTWSLFFDAGAGVLYTTDDVPFNGSSFNFTPQAGFGVTFDVTETARFIGGIKWHHVSNANTFEDNPGRDHVLFYGGISLPF